jgi:hypothetical protein
MLDVTIHRAKEALDWLEFTSTIVKAIAWPLLVGIAGWYFRKELKEAFSKITSIGVGNVVTQFDRGLKEAEALAPAAEISEPSSAEQAGSSEVVDVTPLAPTLEAIAPPTGSISTVDAQAEAAAKPSPSPAPTTRTPNIIAYADWKNSYSRSYAALPGNTPSEKIVEAWKSVEQLISEAGDRYNIPKDLSTGDRIEALSGMGILPPAFGMLFLSQLQLRNIAAQRGSLSEFQARQFVEQLEQSKARLSKILA